MPGVKRQEGWKEARDRKGKEREGMERRGKAWIYI